MVDFASQNLHLMLTKKMPNAVFDLLHGIELVGGLLNYNVI